MADIESHRHVVFGAGGFIGSHLVERLAADGGEVTPVDFVVSAEQAARGFVQADFGDAEALKRLLRPGDIVYPFVSAGVPDAGGVHPRVLLDQSVGATLTFLEACREAKVSRVMFPSSGGTVYGTPQRMPIDEGHPTEPIAAYGVEKVAIEKYLGVYRALHGLDSIVMRIANPFGPRQNSAGKQGLIAALVRRALDGQKIEIWGDGSVVRDFVYIDDVTAAVASLARYTGKERVFNIGAGVGRSVNEVLSAIEGVLGALNVTRTQARAFDVPVSVLDISRISRETGWAPRADFGAALARTIEWARASGR